MKNAIVRTAAALSAAVLCAVPMTSSAETFDFDDDYVVVIQDFRLFKNRIGDANADGQVDYSDSLTIQLAVQYPDKYKVKSTMWADVNSDSLINIIDANLIARYCLRCFDNFQIFFGDVDNDGCISKNDLNKISRYYGQSWNSKTISKDLFVRCDADGSGVIDWKDYNVIRNVYVSMEYKY